jgi:lipopolysaccharide/colanic/teichoic acid biosynthesis glycosyltransferase
MNIKRLFDLLLTGAALLFFLPFGLIIAAILKCTGEGEIFFPQQRVGKDGKMFKLLKFATMLKESPNIGSGVLTVKNDPRVLPFGKFLRKTKINELAQLWNVIAGDMSIIGPRPQARLHFDVFPNHVKKEIVKVKPGLSGVGSIVFRDEENIMAQSSKPAMRCYEEDIAPYKGELEIWYVRNQSLRLDILLIGLTIWSILFPGSMFYEKALKGLPVREGINNKMV